jgi:hypothetical protein
MRPSPWPRRAKRLSFAVILAASAGAAALRAVAGTATWLRLVRDSADDLIALAREGARRRKHRVLARAEIRRQTQEAAHSVHVLLADAEACLARRGAA